MLMAQLRGKLPSETWMGSEDLLTSAVFGTLKNLPPWVTIDLLSKAELLEGTERPMLAPPLQWAFWPWWDTCEPDVVITDDKNICVVEAKLYSSFGRDAEAGNQLRREWRDGFRRAREAGKTLWLVAVTNHAAIPGDVMRDQLRGSSANAVRVAWLGWSEIARRLASISIDLGGWCEDLLELLSRMGLAPFDGFEKLVEHARQAALSEAVLRDVLPRIGDELAAGKELPDLGFTVPVKIARDMASFREVVWQPDMGSNAESPGFEVSLASAREWAERGGWLWRLT